MRRTAPRSTVSSLSLAWMAVLVAAGGAWAQDGAAPAAAKPQAPAAATAPETAKPAVPAAEAPKAASSVFALLQTSKGDILLELDAQRAPVTVANFIGYAKSGHYNGTVFHRVMSGFMIQGGGFTEKGEQKRTNPGIQNEWRNGLKNARGTIAMARVGNQPNSATAQFFINHADNASLDLPRDGAGYAVFGRVISGMDVVDAIAASQTTTKGGMGNWPVQDVVIRTAEIVSEDDAKKIEEAAKAKPAAAAAPEAAPKPTAPTAPTKPSAPSAPATPAKPATPATPATPAAPASPAAPKG